MFKIKITYNGKSYNDIGSAMLDAFKKGMIDVANKKIQPFEQEINEAGGTVEYILDSQGFLKSLIIHDVPDDLKQRITSSLQ